MALLAGGEARVCVCLCVRARTRVHVYCMHTWARFKGGCNEKMDGRCMCDLLTDLFDEADPIGSAVALITAEGDGVAPPSLGLSGRGRNWLNISPHWVSGGRREVTKEE